MKRPFVVSLFVWITLALTPLSGFAQAPSREDLLEAIRTKRAELEALEKQFLAPSNEDSMAYAQFQGRSDQGLIRLLPREIYDSNVYKGNKRSLTIQGGGAYYSFTRQTHEYGYGSDISLDSNHFSVGFAGADYGMLLKLGDVPLEDITLEYPKARFVSEYRPPTVEREVRLEQQRFAKGVLIDEELFKERLPVEARSTFLLRSISYDRTDVLVAFTVVRRDTDGSVIIAWKLLKQYPAPLLARSK